MRVFVATVAAGLVVMAVGLTAEAVAANDVTGWLALGAVLLAVASIVTSGAAWTMSRPTTADEARTRLLVRLSLRVVALAALTAAALVAQAAVGGAAAGWLALASVAVLASLSVVAWAVHTAS